VRRSALTERAYAFKKSKFIKIITLIILVVILLVSVFLYLQASEKENADNEESGEPKIKITDFYFYGRTGNPVGMLFDYWFNITVENVGEDNVSGLVLKVKVFVNDSEVNYGNYFVGADENGTIKDSLGGGEVKESQGALLWVLGRDLYADFSSKDTSVIASVSLNNIVIAEINLKSF
jgi:hypothetical protein